jgi:calcineurin-like phosphoesterase
VLVLAIGDIIGKPGRQAVKELLPGLKKQRGVDLVIANGENVAGGIGLTPATAEELLKAGVDVITSGNHIWAQKDIIPCLDSKMPVLRPMNYPPGVPGRGYIVVNNTVVVNLIGRTFIGNFDCPFRAMDKLLAELPPELNPHPHRHHRRPAAAQGKRLRYRYRYDRTGQLYYRR